MKHTKLFFLLSLSLLLSLSSGGDVPNHKLFADTLSFKLHTNDNDCTSSLGVSMCFGLVYPGASGECARQIKKTLHYPDATDSLVWGATAKRLNTKYDGRCTNSFGGNCYAKNPMVDIANSIWVNGGKLKNRYASVVGNVTRILDFKRSDAGQTVNAWCNEKTRGLIPTILDEGPIKGDLVAVNAIYLNASWTKQFQDTHTSQDHFYLEMGPNSPKEAAHFMHMVDSFDYGVVANKDSGEDAPFQVVRLKYSQSSLSMIIALPANAIAAMGPRLTSAQILAAAVGGDLVPTRLALALPKFRYESKYQSKLKAALKDLGIVLAFEGGFDNILEGDDIRTELYIADIIQKTFVYVYEKGTEAAAVTAMTMRTTAQQPEKPKDPILMILDHPFQFWIYDEKEDLVIFEGSVGRPKIPEGSVAHLNRFHLEEGNGMDRSAFWKKTFNVDAVEDPAVMYNASSGGRDSDQNSEMMTSGNILYSALPHSMVVAIVVTLAAAMLWSLES